MGATTEIAHYLCSHPFHGCLLCGERSPKQSRTYKSTRGFYNCPPAQQCTECRRILDQVLGNKEYQLLVREMDRTMRVMSCLFTPAGQRMPVPAAHMRRVITDLQAVLHEFEMAWRPTIDAEVFMIEPVAARRKQLHVVDISSPL